MKFVNSISPNCIHNCKMVLVLFFAVAILFQMDYVEGRNINCRKYVHLPICRGVAAKRDLIKVYRNSGSVHQPLNYQNKYEDIYSSSRDTASINELLDDLIEKISVQNRELELEQSL